ncbi:DNA repair protein RecN [Anaerosphaera multitolerans]|uniref:DNA repair protein RecN n=1 Tax=Anaerosphaera multitolerans TaxID=2487351 RepID=A0A437S7C9_9FIRM|nr:DNA repair protein RecN [Anaerosphaera multitolerans]RVU54953.1 DNA repair protein RecN [Anaerosphaera multitolerans]
MLLELNIKNFAIIEDLRIEFENGLNVITGETGSGKSIIIDALSIVLGQRASKDTIRTGRDYAFIEAVFSDEHNIVSDILERNNMERSEIIVISKEIKLNRPSITKVNGYTVTSRMLSKITSKLIDIFAQNENISLMNTQNQKKLIDFFCDDAHKKMLNDLSRLIEEISILEREYDENLNSEINKDRELDLLKFQIKEIEDANLIEEEDKKIEREYDKISNISQISNLIKENIEILKSDYNNVNIEDLLDKIVNNSINILKYDEKLKELVDELEDIRYRIKDSIHFFESYLNNVDYSEENLRYLEDRLNTINDIKKKYGNNIEDVYNYLDEISKRVDFLEHFEIKIAQEKEKIDKLKLQSLEMAKIISKNRKEAALFLEDNIEKELRELNIKNAKFRIDFTEKEISKDGFDNIEFMISTNVGEDYKSFSKTASGGEMSRIMLGFKSIIAQKDNIETLIFDEIDTGISGETAQIVGAKIKKLSKEIQIIAISHLPQIVSLGNAHFLIKKEEKENTTTSNIVKLNKEDRILELARLIGGADITETAMKVAEEMLEQ